MARLLRDLDYLKVIQADNLDQIIESNSQIKLDAEQAAQAEMISYLAQRYITYQVFANTTVFSISSTYNARNLVYVSETAYSASTVYNPGDRMYFTDDYIYQCVTTTTAGQNPTTTAAKWAQLCKNNSLFYVNLPYSEWDSETTYSVNDKVWYNDKVYNCATPHKNIEVTNTGFWTLVETYTITDIYPHDAWNTKLTYSPGDRVSYAGVVYDCILTSTNNAPPNITYWTESTEPSIFEPGDNRNQQVVLYLLDITLYHLHSRINPRNVPILRKERYDGNGPDQRGGAIGWLKKVASGDINADLPVIKPQQGVSIIWGNASGETTRSSNTY